MWQRFCRWNFQFNSFSHWKCTYQYSTFLALGVPLWIRILKALLSNIGLTSSSFKLSLTFSEGIPFTSCILRICNLSIGSASCSVHKWILSRSMCDSRRGFELVTRFIDHLYPRLGTTSYNYNAIAHLHTKPQSFIVFLSRCLVTALNNGDSSASVLMPMLAG
jgi:hypothetical protein